MFIKKGQCLKNVADYEFSRKNSKNCTNFQISLLYAIIKAMKRSLCATFYDVCTGKVASLAVLEPQYHIILTKSF